jgi:hypothetical protein
MEPYSPLIVLSPSHLRQGFQALHKNHALILSQAMLFTPATLKNIILLLNLDTYKDILFNKKRKTIL